MFSVEKDYVAVGAEVMALSGEANSIRAASAHNGKPTSLGMLVDEHEW